MRLLLLCLALCVSCPAHANSSAHSSKADPTVGGPRATEGKSSDEAEARGGSLGQPDSEVGAGSNRSPNAIPAALTKLEMCRVATSEATTNNLPAHFFANLIQQESGFRPHVVSPAGAQGIAQFMPPVASAYGLANPFDPVAALNASARLLADLVEQFGNLGLAAAAYNAGPKRVRDWMDKRRKLPAETRHYVHKITGHPIEHWATLRRNGSGIFSSNNPCRDLPLIATNQGGYSRVNHGVGPGSVRKVQSVDIAQHQSETKQSSPDRSLKSRFAGFLPTARAAERAQRHRDATPRRFVATPTPIIMVEENVQSRRNLSNEKRPGSLPRPSEFVVGARVPASIKASEAAVLARNEKSARWAKAMSKHRTQLVDAGSPRGPSGKPQRKS
jgi:hypothetical protein